MYRRMCNTIAAVLYVPLLFIKMLSEPHLGGGCSVAGTWWSKNKKKKEEKEEE